MTGTRTGTPKAAGASARDDYPVFCEGVRALTRIDLSQYKRGQMERRVRSFAERRGTAELLPYLERLKRDPAEVEAFLDRVTINVSQLWRNPEQWGVLAKRILPELAAEGGRVRAWSAGCSYGAEAHTLAALARDVIPSARFEVRGTDIDPRMVERARAGRFSAEDGRDAPKAELRRHFEQQDDGTWLARPEIRRLVTFEVGDLLRLRPRRHAFDLVLCRNTVIYFNEEIRDALHERLVEALRPGGDLVIGSTERVARPRELGLVSSHPFTYRKAA